MSISWVGIKSFGYMYVSYPFVTLTHILKSGYCLSYLSALEATYERAIFYSFCYLIGWIVLYLTAPHLALAAP